MGIMVDSESSFTEGTFRNGIPHGYCHSYYYIEGQKDNNQDPFVYRGEFENGKFNGRGILIYPNK